MRRAAFFATSLAGILLAPIARAADHLDSPSASASAAADITDVYSWMSADETKLNLVMNVVPLATATSTFSDAVQYVWHVDSGAAFGATTTTTNVIATFDADGEISVWVGDQAYVSGDASVATGLGNDELLVFAGLRNDPFFFNLEGFTDAVTFVVNSGGGLVANSFGCPDTTGVGQSQILARLQGTNHAADPAEDFFAGLNVMSIVVQVDVDLVNDGGDVLAVWGSTHNSP